ncbi:hypothetical protein ACFWNN_24975 [Lentzea sp. NPDC058450]|uniref:hypothetical protein n=1 Tax=Lentzea sp. NPDC058450 TaxID=3346505 RepID=UPI003653FC9A
MAPCFDVYVRLPHLDRPTVESFLERHLPSWRDPDAWLADDAGEIIEAGLSGALSGEVLYSRDTRGLLPPELDFVILAFQRDGGVVLGVSVDIGVDQDAAVLVSDAWLTRLLAETGAPQGFFQAEDPPPLTAAEWQESVGRAFGTRSA